MEKRHRSLSQALVVSAAVALLAHGLTGARAQAVSGDATITGFSIPEVDEEGRVKWKLLGDTAVLKASGPVDIRGMRIEMYKNETVDLVLRSTRCLYDRDRQEAHTDTPVEIKGRDIVVTGDGFFWSNTNNLLVIRRNAKVVFTNPKATQLFPGTGSKTNQPSANQDP